jgi:hypothetical protein
VLLAILTGYTFTLLVMRRPRVGRVLFELSDSHGVHVGDIPVAGLWIVGMVCGVLLWRDSRFR